MPYGLSSKFRPALALLFAIAISGLCKAQQTVTLDLPDLTLESSPSAAKSWAADNGFGPLESADPSIRSYIREFRDGTRHQLHFAPSGSKLDMLLYQQFNISETLADVRERIIDKFGAPLIDDRLRDGTLRVTYPAIAAEQAQRFFLVKFRRLDYGLFRDAYAAAQSDEPAQASAPVATSASQSEGEGDSGWLRFGVWALVIGALVVAASQLAPRAANLPGGRIVMIFYEGASDIVFWVFNRMLLVLCILSGFAVFGGAVEKGTSWWWLVPWLLGIGIYNQSEWSLGPSSANEARLEGKVPIIVCFAVFIGVTLGVLIEMN